jgi:hypothetical protein
MSTFNYQLTSSTLNPSTTTHSTNYLSIVRPPKSINMQYSFTILALAAAAFAAPMEQSLFERQAPLCSSGSPQCCATDVLGLVILNCAPRKQLTFHPHYHF